MIIFFFIFCAVSIFISGMRLSHINSTATTRATGRALMMSGVAFAIWTIAVILKPIGEALNFWVGGGAVVFIGGLIFFSQAAVSYLDSKKRQLILASVIIYSVVLIFLRFVLPSNPSFSADGLFFFQPHDIVKFMYVVLMTAVIFPSIQRTAYDLAAKDTFIASIFTASMVANLIGGILLLVSVKDAQDTLLYLVGWGMGVALLFLLLASTGLFHGRAKRTEA